jgi:pimeloyl-ACP methyl ester carboxylesterase
VSASLLDDDRLVTYPLGKGPLFLRRHKEAGRTGKPVLFIHGASAAGDTFLAPPGESVFDYLVEHGLDVWLLDWCGSLHVTAKDPVQANKSVDAAAADLPGALEFIHGERQKDGPDKPISVVGHCMGAACFAMAIGAGLVTPAHGVDKVVLSTIGLFYSVTWDGWMKVMDRVLERVRDKQPGVLTIHPGVTPWPAAFEEVYQMWPKTWGPPWQDEFFHRLAFLYGQPFLVSNLHPKMTEDAVKRQFGAIPFEFYRHAAQNALRGFAIACDAEGNLHPATANDDIPRELARTYLNLDKFVPFSIMLLTGAQNPLWHRDAIDRMGEWLSRNRNIRFTKHVLDGYGHQDLWWGPRSRNDVFPRVLAAVRD